MKKLLLVQENKEVLREVINSCSPNSYQWEIALNVNDALNMLPNVNPDIIICDTSIAVKDIFLFFCKIQQKKDRFMIPVIFLPIESLFYNRKGDNTYTGKDANSLQKLEVEDFLQRIKNNTFISNTLLKNSLYQNNIFLHSENEFLKNLEKKMNFFYTDSNTTIAEVAEAMDMSVSTLQRQIKKYYNLSFRELIKMHRLKKADLLLLNTDKSIESIAFNCGFGSLSYFSKTFKENYNISAKKYRESFLKRNKVNV